jgi:hypothetical protein
VHIRVSLQYPIFKRVSFTHINRGIIYRESYTLTAIYWFCIITLYNFSKISAAVAPFVVHISRQLLVILFKDMSNIFTVKEFILVKSDSLLPSVAKVLLVLILDTV